jgi:hypothetical protein
MSKPPHTRAKVEEIEGKSPKDGEPNEQTVILELKSLGRIKCFDGIDLSAEPTSVSVREEDVGKELSLKINLLNHESPKETDEKPGFYHRDNHSKEWNYGVVGNIEEIENIKDDSKVEENMVLNVADHFVQIKSHSKFREELEEGMNIVFPNNRVDISSVEREK